MDRIAFIEHKGRKILFCDYSNLNQEGKKPEIFALIKYETDLIATMPPKSVYTLTNISNMPVEEDINNALTEMVAHNKPYVKRGAVVGVTGIKQTLFNIMMTLTRRDIKMFANLDQAKEWLTRDE